MRQFFAFVIKEFYHVFRDPKSMLMLFGMPIMLILLFGFALSNEIKNSKIVICDFAQDPASQRIIDKIEASKNFEIKKFFYNLKYFSSGISNSLNELSGFMKSEVLKFKLLS